MIVTITTALLATLPLDSFAQTVVATPIAGSLLVALFQVLRDHTSFQHSQLLQNQQNEFIASSMEEMGRVSFQKLTEFSEEYSQQLIHIMRRLYETGGTDESLGFAHDLTKHRESYILWISSQLNEELQKLEKLLRQHGAHERLAGMRVQVSDKAIDNAFKAFLELINQEQRQNAEGETSIARVIEILRESIGVDRLTNVRDKTLKAYSR